MAQTPKLDFKPTLTAPKSPGVYRFFDHDGKVIYVGKAKDLRRRLAQYRNAKRIKKHAKMRRILTDAADLRWETTGTELQALILENQLIQEIRPRWNVVGAFSFLYPAVGVRQFGDHLELVFSSSPEKFDQSSQGFHWNGVFRSRSATKEFFEALQELLKWVGIPAKRAQLYGKNGLGRIDRYSLVASFRRIPDGWGPALNRYLNGESLDFMEILVLSLAEDPRARARPKQIQRHLSWMKWFWRHEIARIKKIRAKTGWGEAFIPQQKRDSLSLLAQGG
ncbi:MAG: GIY-YIG nuclease family protein [Bdellovibrionales bacterium]|nr:GIY-YIG nuclease family protein [Bdellovibrionales bacterium]